jgi:hypothetical protein
MNKKTIVFRFPRLTWRITWFIAGILLLVSWLMGHHLYYLYFYFIFVGFISLLNSFRKYAVISPNGLEIFYGNYFNRKSVTLSWDSISDVRFDTLDEDITFSGGGRVWITVRSREKVEVPTVFLKYPLNNEQRNEFTEYSPKKMDNASVLISSIGDRIHLVEPPEAGFRKFLLIIGEYISVSENIEKPINPIVYYLFEALILSPVTIGLVMFIVTRIHLMSRN